MVAGEEGPDVLPDLSANDLHSYFVSIGPRVAAEVRAENAPTDLNVRLSCVSACSFQLCEITLDELEREIFGMRNSGACGTATLAFAC